MQTTIRIDVKTKDVLEQLKIIPQEPYEQVITRMITALADDEGEFDKKTVMLLRARLLDKSKAVSPQEMMKRVQKTVDSGSGKGFRESRAIHKSR